MGWGVGGCCGDSSGTVRREEEEEDAEARAGTDSEGGLPSAIRQKDHRKIIYTRVGLGGMVSTSYQT